MTTGIQDAIFLSASVPDPKRGPEYARTADVVAITTAVSALIHVTLGRRVLVWGGHPAITPMIAEVANSIGVEYGQWVRLYQSEHFRDQFPEDNERFGNILYTPDMDGDRAKSLQLMRERMFSDNSFAAAAFVGGMSGIVEEFRLFQQLQPAARLIPVLSTGGAVLELESEVDTSDDDLRTNRDYVALFHTHLGVSVRENRYRTPGDQPAAVEDRYWIPRK